MSEAEAPDFDAGALRGLLTERRRELEGELARLTEPPAEGASVSYGKRVGDGTTEAVERLSTTAAARSITTSIADIDRALDKIHAGTYGSCDECGAPIGAPRLEALPAAALCVTCSGHRT
ncbi:MAG TPA: TraR/DksA C4-type zinc finger protein [Acidimicrobiia bacterium]|nr:TraR/DksA C4-type zinc finger protein [Acidimicrobiia bacterium]